MWGIEQIFSLGGTSTSWWQKSFKVKVEVDEEAPARYALEYSEMAAVFESVLEAAPQFIIQLYAISAQNQQVEDIQLISLFVSCMLSHTVVMLTVVIDIILYCANSDCKCELGISVKAVMFCCLFWLRDDVLLQQVVREDFDQKSLRKLQKFCSVLFVLENSGMMLPRLLDDMSGENPVQLVFSLIGLPLYMMFHVWIRFKLWSCVYDNWSDNKILHLNLILKLMVAGLLLLPHFLFGMHFHSNLDLAIPFLLLNLSSRLGFFKIGYDVV